MKPFFFFFKLHNYFGRQPVFKGVFLEVMSTYGVYFNVHFTDKMLEILKAVVIYTRASYIYSNSKFTVKNTNSKSNCCKA